MTHEFIQIIAAHVEAKKLGLKSVLATVVALDGSSYRRPGVRMLILENERMVGAVSGGCVEKEVLRQSVSVFESGVAKVMSYDGRFRLGCEGTLYILIEPFSPGIEMLEAFREIVIRRTTMRITSFYQKEILTDAGLGSEIELLSKTYPFQKKKQLGPHHMRFSQKLKPRHRLLIVGSEHDAVALCTAASAIGWEVIVVTHPTEEKHLTNFPGARELLAVVAEEFDTTKIDRQTAVVLMTHSYAKDLGFLMELTKTNPMYIGFLGPHKRRERLLNALLELVSEVDATFFEQIYGPAGLHIGAETPQEIAVAIIAEILAVIRQKPPMFLKDKDGGIHG